MYGKLPNVLGEFKVNCKEFFTYQYLPIKMKGSDIRFEMRLDPFIDIINTCCNAFGNEFGQDGFNDSYMYVTAKRMCQRAGQGFNRPGWHTDSFGSPENRDFIWSDFQPTIFNSSKFTLSTDDEQSIIDMESQALEENNTTYPNNTLLGLDPYVVHKVGPYEEGIRTFFKLTFSKDVFNLENNSHNYMFAYDWEMKPRKEQRNVPCA